jgi:hypothetical protein
VTDIVPQCPGVYQSQLGHISSKKGLTMQNHHATNLNLNYALMGPREAQLCTFVIGLKGSVRHFTIISFMQNTPGHGDHTHFMCSKPAKVDLDVLQQCGQRHPSSHQPSRGPRSSSNGPSAVSTTTVHQAAPPRVPPPPRWSACQSGMVAVPRA